MEREGGGGGGIIIIIKREIALSIHNSRQPPSSIRVG